MHAHVTVLAPGCRRRRPPTSSGWRRCSRRCRPSTARLGERRRLPERDRAPAPRAARRVRRADRRAGRRLPAAPAVRGQVRRGRAAPEPRPGRPRSPPAGPPVTRARWPPTSPVACRCAPGSTGSTCSGGRRRVPAAALVPARSRGRRLMAGLLVAGTTSDAGKSVVTTGLCRALARRGVAVAPYKAQNMSNNSMVVAHPDGGTAEIGRAQWVQALAARVRARAGDEPGAAQARQRPAQPRRGAGAPGRGGLLARLDRPGARHLARAAHAAYDDLAARYEVVVAEGAGSPAEINLRCGRLREHGAGPARRPAHRGRRRHRPGRGVRRVPTAPWRCSAPEDQALVAGFVVNKFRGDLDLLQPGPRPRSRTRPGAGSSACCRGAPTCGWTARTPSTSRVGGPARDGRRPGGRGAPAPDLQLHRRRRARPRAGARRRLRLHPARALRRRPGRAARHPGHDRRPGLAARARASTPPCSPTRTRVVRCSASAAAPRCSAARIRDPHGVEGDRRGRRRGPGPARRGHRVHRGEGAARRTSRPATRSTTAGSPGSAATGPWTATMVHGALEDDAHRAAYLRPDAGSHLDGLLPGRPRAAPGPARRPRRGPPRRRRPARPGPPRRPGPAAVPAAGGTR